MNAEGNFKAFRDLFPYIQTKSYKRLDPHSIELVSISGDKLVPIIFTFYGPTSWKLETK